MIAPCPNGYAWGRNGILPSRFEEYLLCGGTDDANNS